MLVKDIITLFNQFDLTIYFNTLKELDDYHEELEVHIPHEDIIGDFKNKNINPENFNKIILMMSYFLIEKDLIKKFIIDNSLPTDNQYIFDLPEHFNDLDFPLVMIQNLDSYKDSNKNYILIVSQSIIKYDLIDWLKWIHKRGCKWEKSLIENCITFKSIKCLKYLYNNYYKKDLDEYFNEISISDFNKLNYIGKTDLKCLSFILKKNMFNINNWSGLLKKLFYFIVKHDNLILFKYFENNQDYEEIKNQVYDECFIHFSINIITYLIEKGFNIKKDNLSKICCHLEKLHATKLIKEKEFDAIKLKMKPSKETENFIELIYKSGKKIILDKNVIIYPPTNLYIIVNFPFSNNKKLKEIIIDIVNSNYIFSNDDLCHLNEKNYEIYEYLFDYLIFNNKELNSDIDSIIFKLDDLKLFKYRNIQKKINEKEIIDSIFCNLSYDILKYYLLSNKLILREHNVTNLINNTKLIHNNYKNYKKSYNNRRKIILLLIDCNYVIDFTKLINYNSITQKSFIDILLSLDFNKEEFTSILFKLDDKGYIFKDDDLQVLRFNMDYTDFSIYIIETYLSREDYIFSKRLINSLIEMRKDKLVKKILYEKFKIIPDGIIIRLIQLKRIDIFDDLYNNNLFEIDEYISECFVCYSESLGLLLKYKLKLNQNIFKAVLNFEINFKKNKYHYEIEEKFRFIKNNFNLEYPESFIIDLINVDDYFSTFISDILYYKKDIYNLRFILDECLKKDSLCKVKTLANYIELNNDIYNDYLINNIPSLKIIKYFHNLGFRINKETCYSLFSHDRIIDKFLLIEICEKYLEIDEDIYKFICENKNQNSNLIKFLKSIKCPGYDNEEYQSIYKYESEDSSEDISDYYITGDFGGRSGRCIIN